MRIAVAVALMFVLSACRAPYMHEYANFTVLPEDLPPAGATLESLDKWFHNQGYIPGPRVRQSEAELRRRPGDPLVYSLEAQRRWWLTQHQAVRDLCVTQKTIYYRLDDQNRLQQAIQGAYSQCSG